MLNQAAVKAMDMDSPVGKRAVINETEGSIIGVVKDFHFRSLHHTIEPVTLLYQPATFYTMVIKLNPETSGSRETIEYIKSAWHEFSPGDTFIYNFLGDLLNNLYQREETLGRVFSISLA